ncbi:metal-dependent hydrolase [Vibrio sp. SS-MA-C1-2]|uniref:metal-dependent hydrolase n=1 Tax=Vibrio sp. SS-MA-C1-2 TaxID=2908646 RepID=UPI001F223632|nr:metal-dependent hydrolase [Vibrio sp. SS-MA-C1-2]UJF17947.1 metal-dependent hydrolase [Vibrio sp. SS-MA-C1-2]
MTGKGHILSAMAMAPGLGYMTYQFDHSIPMAMLSTIFCLLGSTAPDWLEIPIKQKKGKKVIIRRVIKHRTITHVASLWLMLLYFSYCQLADTPLLPWQFQYERIYDYMLFGFAVGGCLHLLGDIQNKQPIPIFTLKDGFALNLFKSGKGEFITIIIASGISTALLLKH